MDRVWEDFCREAIDRFSTFKVKIAIAILAKILKI